MGDFDDNATDLDELPTPRDFTNNAGSEKLKDFKGIFANSQQNQHIFSESSFTSSPMSVLSHDLFLAKLKTPIPEEHPKITGGESPIFTTTTLDTIFLSSFYQKRKKFYILFFCV